MLNTLAAFLYLAVAALCAGAGALTGTGRQGEGRWWNWMALAIFFAGFAAWRFFDVETALETALREAAFGGGGYFSRDRYQRPLAALVIFVFAAGAIGTFTRNWRRPAPPGRRYLRRGSYCAGALVVLVALRLVSFHPIDALLYNGPHLNRVLEPGLVLFAGLQALLVMRDRTARYRARSRSPQRPAR